MARIGVASLRFPSRQLERTHTLHNWRLARQDRTVFCPAKFQSLGVRLSDLLLVVELMASHNQCLLKVQAPVPVS